MDVTVKVRYADEFPLTKSFLSIQVRVGVAHDGGADLRIEHCVVVLTISEGPGSITDGCECSWYLIKFLPKGVYRTFPFWIPEQELQETAVPIAE
jgi:hypothetical protein